jgi:hypothetical protein
MGFALILLLASHGQVLDWDLQTSMTYVRSICPADGGLWCATGGGVFRYEDGAGFTQFYTYPDDLPHFEVRDVLVDSDGRLWAATAAGVACLEDGEWTVYTDFEGIPGEGAWDICEAGGWIFAGSDGGLARWSGDADFVPLDESTTGGAFTAGEATGMAALSDTLWIATDEGIFNLDLSASPFSPSSWQSMSSGTLAFSIDGLIVWEDSLYGYGDMGVFRRDAGRWTVLLDYTSPDSVVTGLAGTPDGLVASCRGVRRRTSGTTWEPWGSGYPYQHWASTVSWDGERLRAGVASPGGLVYDDFGAGLAVLDSGSWEVVTVPGQPSRSVYQIATDDDRTYLGSHNRGLLASYDGEWTSFLQGQGMPNILRTYSASVDPAGGVWTASYHYGLTWMDDRGTIDQGDDSTVTFVSDSIEGLPPETHQILCPMYNNQVVSLAGQGVILWIGQEAYWSTPDEPSGILALTGSPDAGTMEWQGFDESGGLASRNVRRVHAVGTDMLWIAFAGEGGCQLLDHGGTPMYTADDRWLPASGQAFTTVQGLPSNQVFCFAEEQGGTVVIGTGDGICRWSAMSGISSIEGGPAGTVKAIEVDSEGRIWCLGTSAIYCLDGSLLTSFDEVNSPYLPSSRVENEYSEYLPSLGRILFSSISGLWSLEVGQGTAQGGAVSFYPQPFLPGDGEPLMMAGPAGGPVEVEFFCLDGSRAGRIDAEDASEWAWDGSFGGSPAASGVYMVLVRAGGQVYRSRIAVVE